MATLSTAKAASNGSKGNCNCRRNYPWNSWIFALAVLLPQWILEAMLLGSFCWVSNEEILTLTLIVCGFCIECNRSLQFNIDSPKPGPISGPFSASRLSPIVCPVDSPKAGPISGPFSGSTFSHSLSCRFSQGWANLWAILSKHNISHSLSHRFSQGWANLWAILSKQTFSHSLSHRIYQGWANLWAILSKHNIFP
jgi:hypothetical protein